MGDEAGASDNRLTITPSEFPETEEWQDGKRYTVRLEIEQVSPGEFTVMSLKSMPAAQTEEPGTERQPEAEPTEEEKEPAGPPNPAVQRMMAGGGSRYPTARGSY